jgi:hypothetical protein
MEKSCHKEHSCEISNHSKVIGKVKVSDRMTDTTKTICPPIFDLGGIKMGRELI